MSIKIKAYAVFDGGGIKGIAFAGALKAIENSDIEIIGYAGASSGALIAYLSSIGYDGELIYKILTKTNFISLLNQPTKNELSIIKGVLKKRISIGWVGEKAGIIKKGFRLLKLNYCVSKADRKVFDQALKRLTLDYGLYNKDKVENLLKKLTLIKFKNHASIFNNNGCFLSFSDHYKLTNKDFRVISTCLDDGNAIEFSHLKTPNDCIIKALAASASYPIVFQPSNYNNTYITDGGLSCNLPTYTFYNDSFKRFPILAFDLVPKPSKNLNSISKPKINSFFSYIDSMINASLDASTNIISTVTGGFAVTIRLPQAIKATDFEIEDSIKKDLFTRGERYTRFIINHSLLTSYLTDVKNKHDVARLLYGNHDTILTSLIALLPVRKEVVKAWLYTTIDKPETELLSFAKSTNYPSNVKVKDLVFDLNYPNSHSCTESWDKKEMFPIYDSRRNKTYINYPIKLTSEVYQNNNPNSKKEDVEIIALLVISIDCYYKDCNWFTYGTNPNNHSLSNIIINLDISPYIDTIIKAFAPIIRNAILGHQVLFHESRGSIKNV